MSSDIRHAVTDEGVMLPVIDVTHPAFSAVPGDEEIRALERAFIDSEKRRKRMPKLVGKLLMRILLRKSVLARSLQRASGSFLAGMHTYLFKLGPEHLGDWADPIDRKIAAALPAVSIRLRLRDMAELLAEALGPALEAQAGRPLLLLNVGGGPCIDSLNALLILRRDRPSVLDGRRVRIVALDLQSAGPSFGVRALAALQQDGGPLAGVEVSVHHVPYDWSHVDSLAPLVAPYQEPSALIAVSSEGALFEYADDATVAANLRALAALTPPDTTFVASATSDGETATYLQRTSPVKLRPRSIAALESLVGQAGWRITKLIERPMCRDVRLQKA
ncbi:MAG: hypothetical protein IRZ16_00875 [Myxococcaceae bacterium]|nr:hypothetical protein [Myxococcaceae bacterium]